MATWDFFSKVVRKKFGMFESDLVKFSRILDENRMLDRTITEDLLCLFFGDQQQNEEYRLDFWEISSVAHDG